MLDALLSIPLVSFFALPMFSNWSTSLNLLFFYLTWSTLLLSHPPLRVEALGTLAVRLLFYVLPSALFLVFDTLLPSLSVQVKAHGAVALPGRLARTRLAKVVGWSIANVVLGVALQVGVEALCTDVLRVRSALKIATTLPAPWAVLKDLARGFVLRGILQYYIHRHLLHAPRSRLARWHQTWQLSLRAPFPFVANYDHPAVWLLGRFLPLYIPAVLFRFHILTFQLLLGLVSLEEALVYSGYSVLPSTIILSGMARRADAHLLSGGKGNFAPWGLLDWVHGTTVGGDVVDDLKRETEKRELKEKANGAVDDAGSFLDDVGTKIKNRNKGKGKK